MLCIMFVILYALLCFNNNKNTKLKKTKKKTLKNLHAADRAESYTYYVIKIDCLKTYWLIDWQFAACGLFDWQLSVARTVRMAASVSRRTVASAPSRSLDQPAATTHEVSI